MTIIQLSESPELQSIKQQYEDANIEFEPVLKEAYQAYAEEYAPHTKARLIQDDVKGAAVNFVLTFLSEYLLKQLKPKKKGWIIVKAILTLGISLLAENRKANRQTK